MTTSQEDLPTQDEMTDILERASGEFDDDVTDEDKTLQIKQDISELDVVIKYLTQQLNTVSEETEELFEGSDNIADMEAEEQEEKIQEINALIEEKDRLLDLVNQSSATVQDNLDTIDSKNQEIVEAN